MHHCRFTHLLFLPLRNVRWCLPEVDLLLSMCIYTTATSAASRTFLYAAGHCTLMLISADCSNLPPSVGRNGQNRACCHSTPLKLLLQAALAAT